MNTVNTFYIGIDGGGTSCRARIINSAGIVIGEGKSGSANVFQNHQVAWQSVQQAINIANQSAQLSSEQLTESQIVAGLAGAEIKSCADQFLSLVKDFKNFILLTDAQIACLGAHAGKEGAIFIIGTGAIGLAYENETWHQVGGWGFPLDDMGSGAWLGQQAVRVAINQFDGLIHGSVLADLVWQHFNHNSEQLITWSQQASSGHYGEFAPMVLEAFNKQDHFAIGIIEQQTALLSQQIKALLVNDLPLSLMGGLAPWVTSQLPQELKQKLTDSKGDALSGALQFAQQRNHK